MKGLLKKDMLILKQQRFMIGMFLVIIAAISLTGRGDSESMGYGFICGYLMMISSVIGLMTISYDESDNGYEYLMTMPFTRKSYVTSKYMICVLTSLAGAVLSAILVTVSGMAAGAHIDMKDTAEALIFVSCGGLLVSSIGIPTYLKFGSQKGVFAVLIACVVIVAAIFGLMKILEMSGIYINSIMAAMSSLSMMSFALLLMAVCAVIMLLSWYFAQKIMARKEF